METKYTEDHFEEFEKYDVLTDKDIFTKIWTEPRRIFKFINDTQYEKYLYILMIFAGMVRAFDRASSKDMGDHSSMFSIVFGCVILGGMLDFLLHLCCAIKLERQMAKRRRKYIFNLPDDGLCNDSFNHRIGVCIFTDCGLWSRLF